MNNIHKSTKLAFMGLVIAQTAHSIEEYITRLWDTFPPAYFLTGLISNDREIGFIVINTSLVLFGYLCLFGFVLPERRGALGLMWFWIWLELINSIGHIVWGLSQGHYVSGLGTTPVLLGLALLSIWLLNKHR